MTPYPPPPHLAYYGWMMTTQVSQLLLTAIWSVLYAGLPVFLAIKFQVMSWFYPGQKGHSPGYIANHFGTTRQTPKMF